ncbi:MAG: Qat anti-phage system associated protein QatB [Polaromonas sp.]|nr:Qat anti-phage system associated protein QatB [Polaromonas sp.]
MGTSATSAGPGANVSFDPPWLNDIPVGGAGETGNHDGAAPAPAQPAAEGVAPAQRFRGARTSLGAFARNGDTQALGRAAGHYSRTGMGGARNVAARMRTSTKAAAGLGSFLQAARERSDPQITQWMDNLRATNPSAQTVIDAIVSQIIPEGGSIDEESAKDSMAQAMSELTALDPGVDLLALQDAQIWTLMQLYLGHEACNRMYADIGQLFESARFDPAMVVHRTNEMRNFLKNAVAAQLETVRQATPNPTRQQLETLLREVVQTTFTVFEGSL